MPHFVVSDEDFPISRRYYFDTNTVCTYRKTLLRVIIYADGFYSVLDTIVGDC